MDDDSNIGRRFKQAGGWYRIAWAFLKLRQSHYTHNYISHNQSEIYRVTFLFVRAEKKKNVSDKLNFKQ